MVTVANVPTTRTNVTLKNVRVTNTEGRGLNARRPKHPPKLPRMGIRVVKEEARGVARVETPTPRRAHQRPLGIPLLLVLTPRSAHMGITPPLKGLIPRRGDWPGWPSPSWLQWWMSNSLPRSRGAAPKRRTWFSGSSWKLGIKFFEQCLTPTQHSLYWPGAC